MRYVCRNFIIQCGKDSIYFRKFQMFGNIFDEKMPKNIFSDTIIG